MEGLELDQLIREIVFDGQAKIDFFSSFLKIHRHRLDWIEKTAINQMQCSGHAVIRTCYTVRALHDFPGGQCSTRMNNGRMTRGGFREFPGDIVACLHGFTRSFGASRTSFFHLKALI